MRTYIPDREDYAFDQPKHQGSKGVLLQRTKTVIAGDHLDADIYPVLDWQYSREAGKRGKTPEQMARANFQRAFRTLTQLANANFGDGDLILTLTSAEEMALEEFEKVKRRFMGRLRARFKAAGVKMEYLGIVESNKDGRRHHIHMLLRGGVIGRDEVEELWAGRKPKNSHECFFGMGLANADRVQSRHEPKGLEGFCRYITQHKSSQQKLMTRKWFASKGLKRPRATYNDSKFSRRGAAKIAEAAREDAKGLFEKRYPGWELVEYTAHYSDFLPGVYLHAHMRRKK